MFEPVFVPRLYQTIANQIIQKIKQGVYQAGDRLPSERDLAEKLQVSRSTLREAIIALEIEGYVDVRVGAGIFVLELPPKSPYHLKNKSNELNDIAPFDILAVRMLLEPESAALAAQHATIDQLVNIQQAYQQLSPAHQPSQGDYAFHMEIAKASGNAALASNIENLWHLLKQNTMYERMENYFVTQKVWETAHLEHEKIYQAIYARDISGARTAMQQHVIGILARLREEFEN